MLKKSILYVAFFFCISLLGLILSCGPGSEYFKRGRAENVIRYSADGPLAQFGILSPARVYGSDGYLVAEGKVVMDGRETSGEEISAQIVLLETQ
ncbi:hypothetical protein [Nitrosococcus watsonii]|uniref:Lipoprotein n=1 Tax=Nitrosococcus watsoni (strain C-113) TaxID=105559 RepID=D8K7L7_NITWC|nr:hypothetical protein [Nitrosococcus watsonii]ADJ28894.1 hypothetical protein Nwat_2061 [Nitrosococcus watsonii C-113]